MDNDTLAPVGKTHEHVQAVDLRVERARELRFFQAHPDLEQKLAGEWVALDGDELVGHGSDLSEVLKRAVAAGHPNPLVMRVLEPAVTYVF